MEDSLKSNLIGQRNIRLEKLEKIKSLGINPYPAKSDRDIQIGEIKKDFDNHEGKIHTLAGRITGWRTHGKLIFADIKDQTGNIQIIVKSDWLENGKESLSCFSFLHLQDRNHRNLLYHHIFQN